MKRARSIAVMFVGLFLVWVLLTSSFQYEELIAGALVAALITLFLKGQAVLFDGFKFGIKPIFKLFLYFFIFLWQLILANIDVAKRVLSPSLPLNPGVVRVRTKLKSPLAKLMLSSSITLTPGTLTMDIQGQDLFIHWIDVKGKDMESATEAIVSVFEKGLEEVVE